MQQTLGPKRTADYWERNRKRILDKPPGSLVSNDQAGPITLGTRLESAQTPSAYSALVYAKGAFVLHMLRMLMWDPKAHPSDGPFIEMMRDYLTAYTGENASTRDFQHTVERHMTPEMDLAHDGRMDWFFRQWVYGMEIPRYAVKVDVQDAGKDEYRFTGSVAQEAVSADFQGYVPLYIEFESGDVLRFAVVTLKGTQSAPIEAKFHLPKKPKRVVANAFHDVLSRD
jgi:aminopeptidase N